MKQKWFVRAMVCCTLPVLLALPTHAKTARPAKDNAFALNLDPLKLSSLRVAPDELEPQGEMVVLKEASDAQQDLGYLLAEAALGHLGIRYQFGGASPKKGFDCSGLIYYTANNSLGVKLPRTARLLAKIGEKVQRRQDLMPGDLVFFNTRGFANSHVGIYLGGGQFLHAPRTGRTVSIENLNTSYWLKRYNGARRITQELAVDPDRHLN